ncbi:carboxylesterase family protein [Nocardia goodfellowii]
MTEVATIETPAGPLRIERNEDLIHARGVPYASAERLQAPQPLARRQAVRDATSRGPACPQSPSRLDNVTGPIVYELEQSEDCLVLSVTAPAEATELPVMVWFHGGAYVSGGGEAPKYDPDDLAREGVVVVNITYRLGAFGYLNPPGSGADNRGLLDQLTALVWVRDNITAFGGNPASITIFGQSAGGDSVLSLAASPAARGLFHRVIAQSAPLGFRLDKDMKTARNRMVAAMLAAFTERTGGDHATIPTAEVLAGQRAALARAEDFGHVAGLAFAPSIGRAPMVCSIEQAWREVAPDVELLIGFTKDDAAPFVAMNPRAARLGKLGALGRVITRAISRRVTAKIFGDPAEAVARLWREAGGKAATYRFNWEPAGGEPFGATHCIDLPFLFSGDWSDAPMLAGQIIPAELSARMRATWAGFARSGTASLPTSVLRFD